MVLGYVPNLGYGKGTAKSQTSEMKLQDKHNCLFLITNQITKIHNEGGFWTKVMGRHVCVKVWIHLIAGNTLGHNTLVGHFNGGLSQYIYVIGHGIGGMDIPAKMAQLAKSLSQE